MSSVDSVIDLTSSPYATPKPDPQLVSIILAFLKLLVWLDGRPLLSVLMPYQLEIIFSFCAILCSNAAPWYKRGLIHIAKKNGKTLMLSLAAIITLHVIEPFGNKGAQVVYVANDLAQANEVLVLTRKLYLCNPILLNEVEIRARTIQRNDGRGFIEIVPAGDCDGLHGKTYRLLCFDELHAQKDYRLLEALELDPTRPDAQQLFSSYSPVSPRPGTPIVDMLKQHASQSDARLFVFSRSGTIEDANPSLNGPLGSTREDIVSAQLRLPSWMFRRLYLNLPGQPDGAAFDAGSVETCVVKNRVKLPPVCETTYIAFVDMSGGGPDDSTLAIAHLTDEGRVVLDQVLDQGPRGQGTFDPHRTVKKFASVCKQYGCDVVTGDRYAAEWPVQAFSKEGIAYETSDFTRSELYAKLEPLLNSGTVELLDHPKLFAQLIGLIRRGERIDHPPTEHDDHANAAAGALVFAHLPTTTPGIDVLDWPTSSGPTFRDRTSWSLLR